MADHEVPVLIAGGSLVGMTTALLLGRHGIRPLVVEHHRGTAIHPRAAMINQRTMEIFRETGIERIVREKSGEQFDQDGAIMSVETLAGKELAWYIANLNEHVRDVSPCSRVFITQSLLEPLLQQRALTFGADLRFSTDLISFEQDADGVTAIVRNRDSGATETVRARYMVAADGSHSSMRERLGIPMRGRGVFSNSVTIYFRAPVAPLIRGRNLSVIMVVNPVLRGFFRIEKPYESGFLAVHTIGDPANPDTNVSASLTGERCLEYVHAGLGTSEIPVTIENVMHWQSTADIAERFSAGRVFLAGDAAHVMPPYGGFGGNCGIHDAHNLAWKLALVLKGIAHPELLATYDPERRPAGAFTVEQAYSRYVTRAASYLGTSGMQPLEDDLNIELGHCYGPPPVHENPRESKGRPGSRAPHVWIERDGERISTLDLFGKGFVVLAGPDAGAFEVPGIETLRIDNDAFTAAYGIGPAGAALVRPDGFVAWRSHGPASVETISQALASALAGVPIV
ncbi:MAG TPA: FAD-dependent monooxygenase [Bryobacteraceae bacterium]|jgi:2-polyprenyl-6-methoxyphenol hydroxylase-like FAD-dependent oxidoreductase|nr:FAD-dependent monooxygenase [Bryobacteraceae bacterium]